MGCFVLWGHDRAGSVCTSTDRPSTWCLPPRAVAGVGGTRRPDCSSSVAVAWRPSRGPLPGSNATDAVPRRPAWLIRAPQQRICVAQILTHCAFGWSGPRKRRSGRRRSKWCSAICTIKLRKSRHSAPPEAEAYPPSKFVPARRSGPPALGERGLQRGERDLPLVVAGAGGRVPHKLRRPGSG
jgi:hypothetical protein